MGQNWYKIFFLVHTQEIAEPKFYFFYKTGQLIRHKLNQYSNFKSMQTFHRTDLNYKFIYKNNFTHPLGAQHMEVVTWVEQGAYQALVWEALVEKTSSAQL